MSVLNRELNFMKTLPLAFDKDIVISFQFAEQNGNVGPEAIEIKEFFLIKEKESDLVKMTENSEEKEVDAIILFSSESEEPRVIQRNETSLNEIFGVLLYTK